MHKDRIPRRHPCRFALPGSSVGLPASVPHHAEDLAKDVLSLIDDFTAEREARNESDRVREKAYLVAADADASQRAAFVLLSECKDTMEKLADRAEKAEAELAALRLEWSRLPGIAQERDKALADLSRLQARSEAEREVVEAAKDFEEAVCADDPGPMQRKLIDALARLAALDAKEKKP